MQQERIERYIRSRRQLELALHAIRPSDRAGMVQQGVKFLMLGVPDSVLAAFDKITDDRTAFGYLDQYIAPERVLAKVREFDRLSRMNSPAGFSERFEQVREKNSLLIKDIRVGHELLMKSVAARRGITEGAQLRATLFLTEYITDRPNLRGSSVFEIEQTAFKLFTHLPDNLIEFCEKNKACEEAYRMLDPWVGLNIDLIKTKI